MTYDDRDTVCQKGKFRLEEWEDVNYCEHCFYNGDEPLEDEKVVVLLSDLTTENEQLKQLLDYADDLIHSHLSEHFIKQWTNFKMGHKEYNDFWEETLKKYNELER